MHMVKKMKSAGAAASPAASRLLDNQLAHSVKESAQQIWLAGMGAFSKAQEEGSKVFETLVKEGITLQKKTQGIAEDKISEVTGRMSAMAGNVTAKAGQNWDKLEQIFEQRTAKAMNKLGVPTAADVEALVKRVDELAAAVARLSKAGPVKAAAGATRTRAVPAKAAQPLAKARPAVKKAAKSAVRTAAKTASGGAGKAARKSTIKSA
jgi:poly(hydroxyalkanoate) granule-associated protein